MFSCLLVVFFLSAASAKQIDIHVRVNQNVYDECVFIATRDAHNAIDFKTWAEPHITLYLTDFLEGAVPAIVQSVRRVTSEFKSLCHVQQTSEISASQPYALWNTVENTCLQRLSDAVVNAVYMFAKPNQTVPSWVYNLPEPERSRKIAMVKKFGSPNVFSEFEPHITVAYDTAPAMKQIYDGMKLTKNVSFVAQSLGVSWVGKYGTVLKAGSLANVTISGNHQKTSNAKLRKIASSTSSSFAHRSNDWDYFLLVREWPGTMAQNPLPSYINTFTLHGLWPNRNDGSWPQFCNDSYPFSFNEISPIYDQLDVAWFDTMHGQVNGTSFWSHEWDKHGTCAMSDSAVARNERAYFQLAINLHNQMTEAAWLAAAGIVPIDPGQQLYSKSDFINTIGKQLGVTPLIRCTNWNGYNVIEDVGVCLDKSARLISCPQNQVDTWDREQHCDDQIGFPAVPH